MVDLLTGLRKRWLIWLCAGAVAALGQAPVSQPILSLLGFLAVFVLFALCDTSKQAFRCGMAVGTGYFLISLNWIVEPFMVDAARHAWMAPFALLSMAGGLALFWGGAFWMARRSGSMFWALAFTLSFAELLRAYMFTGFPWASPAYGLVDTSFAFLARFGGAHGLNLVFLLFAGSLAAMLQCGHTLKAAAGLVVFAAGSFFALPEQDVNASRPVLRLVQPNAPQHQKWDPVFRDIFLERALDATAATATRRPDLIIWPETAVPEVFVPNSDLLRQIADKADGVPTVLGMIRFDGPRLYNSAVLSDAKGTVSQIYDKVHLVPFGEYVPFGDVLSRLGIRGLAATEGQGFAAGQDRTLMDIKGVGRALPLICYEVVFAQDIHTAPMRPDFLMQITNDAWFGEFSGPYQHMQQARMRAIEQGLPLVRAANTGVSALIDINGRVRAELALGTSGFLDVPLPEPGTPTLYSKTKDWPIGGLLLLVNVLLLLRASRKAIDPNCNGA